MRLRSDLFMLFTHIKRNRSKSVYKYVSSGRLNRFFKVTSWGGWCCMTAWIQSQTADDEGRMRSNKNGKKGSSLDSRYPVAGVHSGNINNFHVKSQPSYFRSQKAFVPSAIIFRTNFKQEIQIRRKYKHTSQCLIKANLPRAGIFSLIFVNSYHNSLEWLIIITSLFSRHRCFKLAKNSLRHGRKRKRT